jgi:hypothetical protein
MTHKLSRAIARVSESIRILLNAALAQELLLCLILFIKLAGLLLSFLSLC